MENENNKGITLLYSMILIALMSIILGSLSFLVIRSLNLTFSAEKSQLAYYAAETGAECAFYWDHEQSLFGRRFSVSDYDDGSGNESDGIENNSLIFETSYGLNCFKEAQVEEVEWDSDTDVDYSEVFGHTSITSGYVAIFRFKAQFPETNQCAHVEIYKSGPKPPNQYTTETHTGVPYLTRIQSKGYDSCNNGNPTLNAVERGIEKIYGEIPE